MYSDVEQYLHYQIANARVLSYPFPHFFVDQIFPPDWYRNELIAQLPDLRLYKRLDETGTVPKGAYPERYVCDLEAAARAELELDGERGPWALLQQYIFQFYWFGRWLRLVPVAVAVALTAVAFAAVHFPRWPVMAVTLIAGTAWALIYYRWRSLLPLAVSHALLGTALHYWVFGNDLLERWLPQLQRWLP